MLINSIGNTNYNIFFNGKFFFFKDLDKSIKENNFADIKNANDLFLVNNDKSTLLHSSAKYNQLLISKYLLKHGLSPNIKNKRRETPFLLACSTKNEKLIKEFLLYNPDVNTQNCIDETPMHKVISSPVLTNLLLNAGASPYIKNYAGNNAVHCAYKYSSTLELLFKRNINPNTLNDDGQSLFHKSAEKNDIQIAELLKKYNAEINLKDKSGKTPLFYINNKDTLDWFLDNGANINLQDNNGITPIHEFVSQNNFELIKELINKKININIPDKNGLFPLAYTNDFRMINLLLEAGVNPNFYFPSGNTILHNAVKANEQELVYLLIQHKANPNMTNTDGDFPLDYATNDTIRTILLTSGAQVNEKLYVHQAVKENNYQYLENLLECKASLNNTDYKGNTPIYYSQNEKILNHLIENNADLLHRNKFGLAPIHHFAWLGNKKFVDSLKKHYNTEFLNAEPKTLNECTKDFENYNSWLKKKNNISFTGYGVGHYGTEDIRRRLNYNVQLTEEKINNIMKNANSTDEGLLLIYKELKKEHEEIINSKRNFFIIIKHYNFIFKQELCKILKMNPTGSKVPIVGIFVQLANRIWPEDFTEKLVTAMNNIGDDYNTITNKYYSTNMNKQMNDYTKIAQYILNGIKYVNYFKGETKLRNTVYDSIEKLLKSDNKNYHDLGTKLNNMAQKYQNSFDKILEMQNKKQNKRLGKKIIWKILSLGTA